MMMAVTTGKRLKKDGLTEEANKVFQTMIAAGAMEKLSEPELCSWDGPKH